LDDETLANKIDDRAEVGPMHLISRYSDEVAALISETIEGWDPKATSERIEEQIGKDLQFIRINGGIVAGLVGLSIHVVRALIEKLSL
jgi:uncharacterized membrane-anchored protein YjiN (DUF445 family)